MDKKEEKKALISVSMMAFIFFALAINSAAESGLLSDLHDADIRKHLLGIATVIMLGLVLVLMFKTEKKSSQNEQPEKDTGDNPDASFEEMRERAIAFYGNPVEAMKHGYIISANRNDFESSANWHDED